jgi:hypothetical protein
MRTLAKTASRPNYLFSLLPQYFKENDSYKDGNNEGLLERYLEIFCAEVDSQVAPYIDNAHYLFDAENLGSLSGDNPDKFLDYLSSLFGNPPYMGTDLQYKALIKHIVWILKTKGTFASVELFLNLLGYTISSYTEETFPDIIYDATPTVLEYDDSLVYDDLYRFYSDWDLIITDLPGTGPKSPTSEWLTKLKLAIQKFLCPIFATLNSVTYNP